MNGYNGYTLVLPADEVEGLRNIDIVKVIKSYIPLKKDMGGYTWSGLCPFHKKDDTLSFVVVPGKGNPHFICYGCGKSGDTVDFIRKKERISFWPAYWTALALAKPDETLF